jgi:hypothetical protein
MNIAAAMSVCSTRIQRAFQALPELLSRSDAPAPGTAQDAPCNLRVVYKCNTNAVLTTCRCGTRFVPDAGIWPFAVGSDRPVCVCCDSHATEITSSADLCRAAAQAHFLFHVDQEVTMQTVAALRSKRIF